MTVLEALHADITPVVIDRSHLLYEAPGQPTANFVGDGEATARFKAGLVEFDNVYATRQREYPNRWRLEQDDLLVRGVLEGAHRLLEASLVIEPLPGHPVYDERATSQYFVNVRQIVGHDINREIEPGLYRPSEARIVRLLLGLGVIAQHAALRKD